MPRVNDAYLEAKRTEIIEAAMTCFAKEGFHRTTMQDIVRESGLSAGAIYRYFPSKEDIVAAIAEGRRTPDTALLQEVAETTDVRDGFRTLIHGSLGPLADPSEQRWRRVTVQVWAEALRDPRVMRLAREGLDEPLAVITELIGRGQKDGTLPAELDPAGAARVCTSLFYGLVLQQAWDPDVDVDAYTDAVLMLLGAMARPPKRRASRTR